ncbi:Hypothetical protein NocV09_04400340 [Nannochloropsis oceanica]
MQQEPSSKRRAALQRREDSLFHQTAGFASAFFLLSSPSFALPTPVSAAEDKTAEIKEARDKLLIELEEGKNINRLETAIQNADWDTLKQVSKQFDAYLRGDLMGTARKGALDKKAANSIREATMYSLIKVNKGARASDAAQAQEGVNELRSNLKAFLSLPWKTEGEGE